MEKKRTSRRNNLLQFIFPFGLHDGAPHVFAELVDVDVEMANREAPQRSDVCRQREQRLLPVAGPFVQHLARQLA